MKNGKKKDAPESFVADSVGFVQKRSIPNVIFGMLCRFVTAFVGVSGVCLMFDNAFMFDNGVYRPGNVILASLVFCTAWFILYAASNINGVFFAVTAAVYAASFVYGAVSFGLKEAFFYVPLSLWNHILVRLDTLGYNALSGLKVELPSCDPLTSAGAGFARIGFYAFIALISLIFVSCLYKKVKAVPVIISAGIVMTLTFTYNLLTDNLGFVLTVASGFGILVLIYFTSFTKNRLQNEQKNDGEGFFVKRRRSLSHASAPGLAALLAVAVVFAVAAVPASRITDPAPRVTLLDGVIDEMRKYFSEYLTGDRGEENMFDAPKKSTEPTPRIFTEKEIFTVTAQYPTPKYMRAWVSESYSNNKWTSASASECGVQILPEEITELFYTVVDIDANVIENTQRADTGYLDRGFIKERVTVKSGALSGEVGLLASRFSTLGGITEAGTKKAYGKGYRIKEGVGTAELSLKNAKYDTVAYTPSYKSVILTKLDDDVYIYDTVLPYIEGYANRRLSGKADGAELEQWLAVAIDEIKYELSRRSLELPSGSLIYRVSGMTDGELSSFTEKLNEARKYESYVYENCASVPWSDEAVLENAASKAFGGAVSRYGNLLPSEVYTRAVSAADYLANTCAYTLVPDGYTNRGSYVAQFLTSAKNGYCVQYASAGALMLRVAGIPTRYVDGYLASDFQQSGDAYVSSVRDSHAHAWVEAYVRGYGWMTFEMTEPMLDGLYRGPGQDTDVTDTEDTDAEDEETDGKATMEPDESVESYTKPYETEPEETVNTGTQGYGRTLTKTLVSAGITVLCIAVLSTLIYVFIIRTAKRAKKRREMLKKAADGNSDDPEKDIKEISEYIFFLFERAELKRGQAELLTDFVKRADGKSFLKKSFGPAAHAIQKNSFGRCADAKDCKDAADYALYLQGAVKQRLTSAKKFYYCKVMKLI